MFLCIKLEKIEASFHILMTMINIQTIARHKYSDRNTIRTITQDKLSKIIYHTNIGPQLNQILIEQENNHLNFKMC